VADPAAAAISFGYSLFGLLLRPAVPFILSRRVALGKEDRQRTTERYGRASAPRPPGRLVWVHAASVGETNAVLPLVGRLTAAGLAVLFTSTTLTSAGVAAKALPKGAVHQFAPLDIGGFVDRFLGYWRPELAIFVESELWPTIVRRLAARDTPLVLVNASLSERSFHGWKRVAGFAGNVFGKIALCLAQTGEEAARFRALGAPDVRVTGNLKFDVPLLAADPSALALLKAAIGNRPVWVAASTHEGEEEFVADAHRNVRERHPGLLTILVPRHPPRGDAVRALLEARGLKVAQRSRANPLTPEIDVYLADTLGELGLFYRAAPIAFLGGSLVPIGGHNPIEPVQLGAAVLHGPHVQDQTMLFALLDNVSPLPPITDAASLAALVAKLLGDPAATAEIARRGLAAVLPQVGALDATMSALKPYLKGAA
jgi:3-deoxy-D-manno-octulosonic-acid transferase